MPEAVDTKREKVIDTFMPEGEDPFAVTRLLEETNIADKLSEDERTKIAREVCEGYEADERSRREWLERSEEWIRLASMLREVKTHPWPNAANVKYPLLTQAVISFGARLYPALINGVKPVKARVSGSDPSGIKQESAIRVERHMSYQVLEEMEEWEEEMDRLIITLPILGCAFKKTYFSPSLGRNVSEFVHPKDLCVNYYAKTLETAQRITHIMEMSHNDLHERMKDGRYLDIRLSSMDQSVHQLRRSNSDKINKTEAPVENDPTFVPRLLIEQHTWIDLDGDGYKEPYIVVCDVQDRKLLRIVARYEAESIFVNEKDEVVKIDPTNYFTKFSFIPNPDGGFYDIGFGLLLGSLNETTNTLINQLLDAGTLSNMQSGFLSRGIRLKGGRKTFIPGEWKVVNASSEDLHKGVFPLPVRDPSQVLYLLLGTLLESGQRLAQTVDILVGENPGQNQAATTTLAVIEQGLKVFNAIYKRSHRSLKQEFKKLHRLNSIYLSPEQYFTAIDDPRLEAQKIYQLDYHSGMTNVIPYSDPNVSSEQQRLAKAGALLEMMHAGIQLNPDEVRRRLLEAQDQPNIEQLTNIPEPQPSIDELKYKLDVGKHNHQVEMDLERLKLEQTKTTNDAMVQESVAALNTVKAMVEQGNARLAEIETLLATLQHIAGGTEGKGLSSNAA